MTCHSSATKTKILDIGKIAERLFEQDRIRGKLCRDFGIESIGDPMNFAESLVNSIGQVRPAEGSTADSKSNSTVFRAAALALASNMRQWSKFLKSRKEFECLLENYDPVAFCKAVKCDHTRVEQLGKCLGGQTGRPDAEAIVQWARILTNHLEYFQALKVLKKRISTCVLDDEVVPVLAAFLGDPRKRAEKQWPPLNGMGTWKTPGMRMVLASEFLRNLHWAGFKPDRHIIRLFLKWFPDVIEEKSQRAVVLARNVLCCRSDEMVDNIKFALVGTAVTPERCNYTMADNLVWALGSYVEKKNRESEVVYWKTIGSA